MQPVGERPPPYRLEAIQVAAWATWSGALLVTGLTAYFVFTLLKRLDPTLPDFSAYEGEHWRLLGGYVAERLFIGADVVGFLAICIGGGAFALACWRGHPHPRSWTAAIRALLVMAMVGIMTYRFAVLDPAMQADLAAYRQAAALGDTQNAIELQQAYDVHHRTASNVMVASLLLSLGALGFTLATTRRVMTGAAGDRTPAPKPSRLQEPELARGPRR
ncbi:MAG: hypothetical protein RIE77_12205 [Phycisphaerales bacterium]|jgi:hypothetical protein